MHGGVLWNVAYASARQRGAATLTVSLAILLLGTLVVLGVSQAVVMEQKIANNSVRAAQAFEAAEAGMHAALDYLDTEPDRDGNGGIDPVFDTNGDGTGDTSAASIGNGSVSVATQDLADGAMTRIAVTATGYSDDRSAHRTLTQTFVTLDPVPHLPRIPLIAGGALEVHGTANVRNAHGHDAVWSGGNAGMDAGIVANDTTLAALAADDLFRVTFGLAPAAFAVSLVTRAMPAATFDDDAQLATRAVVRVDGNTTLGDVTLGCSTALIGNASCAAEARRPVVLVIAGNAEFAGDTHLYGLLFVSGNTTVTRTAHVHGAAVVAGNVTVGHGAELHLTFDTAVLADLHKAGPMTPLAGTWNEF